MWNLRPSDRGYLVGFADIKHFFTCGYLFQHVLMKDDYKTLCFTVMNAWGCYITTVYTVQQGQFILMNFASWLYLWQVWYSPLVTIFVSKNGSLLDVCLGYLTATQHCPQTTVYSKIHSWIEQIHSVVIFNLLIIVGVVIFYLTTTNYMYATAVTRSYNCHYHWHYHWHYHCHHHNPHQPPSQSPLPQWQQQKIN